MRLFCIEVNRNVGFMCIVLYLRLDVEYDDEEDEDIPIFIYSSHLCGADIPVRNMSSLNMTLNNLRRLSNTFQHD